MAQTQPYLKELDYFLNTEVGLLKRKSIGRGKHNFERIMQEMDRLNNDADIRERYERNIEQAKSFVESLSIVHHTQVPSMLGIIEAGAVLSTDQLEARDENFFFRITSKGIPYSFEQNVFGFTHTGDWLYGLCKITFKKEVESLPEAFFLPKSNLSYEEFEIPDYLMDIKYWREYLAEHIALSLDNVESFVEEVPVYDRPEFLFKKQVELDYIDHITCATQGIFEALQKEILAANLNPKFLDMLKVASWEGGI